ncbi:hypothetical protein Scep_026116 [Stephania cephalantha]|uniref:Uncharacterized protein n=1 Tax=Stephania cephalantha TaxID=152367 RepID=A0AAP0HRS5_9MAGN
MTTKAAATADDLHGDSLARWRGQSTAAARTAATSGLANVVATMFSMKRRRYDEASAADSGETTSAC